MAKRKSVNYPGYSHQNPIPNGSRIGNIAMSSYMLLQLFRLRPDQDVSAILSRRSPTGSSP